jgi:hypothetical protein
MSRARLMKSFHEFVMTREEYNYARNHTRARDKQMLTREQYRKEYRRNLNDSILTSENDSEREKLWTSHVKDMDDDEKLLLYKEMNDILCNVKSSSAVVNIHEKQWKFLPHGYSLKERLEDIDRKTDNMGLRIGRISYSQHQHTTDALGENKPRMTIINGNFFDDDDDESEVQPLAARRLDLDDDGDDESGCRPPDMEKAAIDLRKESPKPKNIFRGSYTIGLYTTGSNLGEVPAHFKVFTDNCISYETVDNRLKMEFLIDSHTVQQMLKHKNQVKRARITYHDLYDKTDLYTIDLFCKFRCIESSDRSNKFYQENHSQAMTMILVYDTSESYMH